MMTELPNSDKRNVMVYAKYINHMLLDGKPVSPETLVVLSEKKRVVLNNCYIKVQSSMHTNLMSYKIK